MKILTSVRRLYIRFKSLVNDFVYSFGRAALLLLVEVQNHTVPVRERRRIRDSGFRSEPTLLDHDIGHPYFVKRGKINSYRHTYPILNQSLL